MDRLNELGKLNYPHIHYHRQRDKSSGIYRDADDDEMNFI